MIIPQEARVRCLDLLYDLSPYTKTLKVQLFCFFFIMLLFSDNREQFSTCWANLEWKEQSRTILIFPLRLSVPLKRAQIFAKNI